MDMWQRNYTKKQHGEKYATYVKCLNRMKPNSEDSMHPVTSFMEYTSQWVTIINRGELY